MAEGNILLVDDDHSVLLTMRAILEMDGYAVTAVAEGARAIALLGERTYDLVLTDLRLEDMDGLTVLAEVQRAAAETVTIMLTGYASLESAVKALREGAYAYLIKPCNVDELRATIARGMERRRLTQQLRQRVGELEDANRTIQSLNAGLQERVDDATARLQAQMAELARAKEEITTLYGAAQRHVEQLEELDRLKSQFLSMASHELKTPLTSISGFLQIELRRARRRMAEGYPDPEAWARETELAITNVDTIHRQTRRLSRLVNELLDVSRIQTGNIEYLFSDFDLGELVAEAAERARATTTQHQIRVHADVEDARVMADRDHIEQVLSNLLSNAIKYSPEGGPITVSLDSTADQVRLRVEDRGIGITADQQQAIFGLFYRSPDAKSRAAGGMGLGLYISHEIVKRHGGAIRVESASGEGSAFIVTLPRIAAHPAGAATVT